MDEILIGDKNYISSRRAAKLTGYAKDYIGQLCREGRVAARLVGRSWYVLETAIQDHRFGAYDAKPEKAGRKTLEKISLSTWEAPRYESAASEPLPPVGRAPAPDNRDVAEQLQDSWRAWFDHVAAAPEKHEEVREEVYAPAAVEAVAEPEEEPREEEEAEKKEEKEPEESAIPIPIHAVYELPPEDLLPRRTAIEPPPGEEPALEEPRKELQRRGGGIFMGIFRTAGVLIALIFATLAVFGTGYFDNYIISSKQAAMIAGVSLYNR